MKRKVVYKPILTRIITDKLNYAIIEKYLNDNLVNLLGDESFKKDLLEEKERPYTTITYYHEDLTEKEVIDLLNRGSIHIKPKRPSINQWRKAMRIRREFNLYE